MEGWNAGGGVPNPDDLVYEGEEAEHDKRTNKDFFLNAKAKGWWNVRDRARKTWLAIEHNKEFDPDELLSFDIDSMTLQKADHLIAELASPKMEYMNGKVKVESKQKMKDRGLDSPNDADSCIMSFVEVETEDSYGLIF